MGAAVVAVDREHARCVCFVGLVEVLEVLRREHRCVGQDLLRLGLACGAVAEVGAEGAAALVQLLGWFGEDSLAPIAEQAGPIGFKELSLESPNGVSTIDLDELVSHTCDITDRRRQRCGRHDQCRRDLPDRCQGRSVR